MKIDFVSDISCPWCAIGLRALELALERAGNEIAAELHFQPFELNPHMPPEGQNLDEHIRQKYGFTPEESGRARETLRARGAELGVTFNFSDASRIYNTFDAHRLLHWAGIEGRQHAVKQALFKAYFTDDENPSAHEVLIRVASEAGLDAAKAREILGSDAYAHEVRERERFYRKQGIEAVPSIIIDSRHLIQGGQPVEVFERVLRDLAAKARPAEQASA